MIQTKLFLDKIEEIKIVNVSQVNLLSPFRYPGGKTWLVPMAERWISSYKNKYVCIEPFVGGGIISLSLLNEGLIEKSIMGEIDDEVSSVWKTILYGDAQWLMDKILHFDLNIENVKKVIESSSDRIEEKAFRTIIKNRTYHGGILAPGSGLLKRGDNGKGILSRWYPTTIVNRIKKILLMKEKMEFIEGDGFQIIEKYLYDDNCIFFIDPPYTASKKKAGKRLYRHCDIDHEKLFKLISTSNCHFMMTYDDDIEIRNLCEKYQLQYISVPMKGTHHVKLFELVISDNFSWIQRNNNFSIIGNINPVGLIWADEKEFMQH